MHRPGSRSVGSPKPRLVVGVGGEEEQPIADDAQIVRVRGLGIREVDDLLGPGGGAVGPPEFALTVVASGEVEPGTEWREVGRVPPLAVGTDVLDQHRTFRRAVALPQLVVGVGDPRWPKSRPRPEERR